MEGVGFRGSINNVPVYILPVYSNTRHSLVEYAL